MSDPEKINLDPEADRQAGEIAAFLGEDVTRDEVACWSISLLYALVQHSIRRGGIKFLVETPHVPGIQFQEVEMPEELRAIEIGGHPPDTVPEEWG
jgi:hypothetical protein